MKVNGRNSAAMELNLSLALFAVSYRTVRKGWEQ